MKYIKARLPLLFEIFAMLGIIEFSGVIHYEFPRKAIFTICIVVLMITEYHRGKKSI